MIKLIYSAKTFQSLGRLVKKLQRTQHALERRSKAHKAIMQRQITRWDKNFGAEGAEYGSQWAALSEDWTVEERGSSSPILVRSGDLHRSFVGQNAAGVVTDDAVKWSFHNAYPPYPLSHHTGYPNPISNRADIPARPLWQLDNKDEEAAREELDKFIKMQIKQNFG